MLAGAFVLGGAGVKKYNVKVICKLQVVMVICKGIIKLA